MPRLLEIQCIQKTPSFEQHERIATIGGVTPGGVPWRLTQGEAIAAVEAGTHSFYVFSHGDPIEVIVSTSEHGFRFLKTTADGKHADILLRLPPCR